MSLRELNNQQIDEYYKNESRYGGCFSASDINKIGKGEQRFYILNLDKPSGVGSHWVLLYMCEKDVGIYADSYGLSPPEQVVKYMKKFRTHNIRNIGGIQHLKSSACGFYCLFLVDMLLQGKSLVDTIAMFDTRGDLWKNDSILHKYFFPK